MRNILSFIFIFFSTVTYSQTIDFRFSNGTSASFSSSDVWKVTHTGATLNLLLRNGPTINYNVDDIVFYNFNAAPVILTSLTSLPEFDTLCAGSASSPASYSVTGYQLTSDVRIVAPTDYEISTSSGSGFDSVVTLIPASGNLNSTIYVRFLPNSVNDLPFDDLVSYGPDIISFYKKFSTGLITHAYSGGAGKNISVLGTGVRTGVWVGPAKGNWVNAANWCGGIPTSSVDAIIPPGDTVVINSSASVKSLWIDYSYDGARGQSLYGVLHGGNSTLNIYHSFYEFDNFIPQTGTIAYRGSLAEQTIRNLSGANPYYNLSINKSSGKIIGSYISVQNNLSLSSDSLIITGELNLSGSANFNDKVVILQSDETSTAVIPALPNNGSTVDGATNFTMERYIPANEKWRALSMPLSSGRGGNSIYNHWQNNGSVISGAGVLLWSNTSLSGFSLNTNAGASQNIRKYVGGTGFDLLNSTTNELLFSGGKPVPYLVFVTDYYKPGTNVGNMGSGTTPTKLRATGSLFKGNYNSGNLSQGFHMIPNPYPAAIDLTRLSLNNLDQSFYIWDPLLEGFRGFGGYQTYNSLTGIFTPGGGSAGASTLTYLPANSAFWVFSNGSGNISMNELSKDFTSGNYLFGRRTSNASVMRINLKNSTGDVLLDGVAAAYLQNASAEVDAKDSKKFGLSSENIYISRNNTKLAVECRPMVESADTVFIGLNQLKQQPYSLHISTSDFNLNNNLVPVLEDLYLNKQTILDLNGLNKIDFNADGQSASSGNRFRIVFRQNATTAVNALDANKGIQVYPNPVNNAGALQLSFNNQPAGEYRLVIHDIAGVQIMNRVFQHGGGTAVQSLMLPDNILSGNYIGQITGAKGKTQQIKLTIQ